MNDVEEIMLNEMKVSHKRTIIVWLHLCMVPKGSLVVQLVKNLPAIWETWVQSLGWEDPLEKEKALFLPEEFQGLYSPWGCKETDMTEQLSLSLFMVP